jgi:hypothetical protein
MSSRRDSELGYEAWISGTTMNAGKREERRLEGGRGFVQWKGKGERDRWTGEKNQSTNWEKQLSDWWFPTCPGHRVRGSRCKHLTRSVCCQCQLHRWHGNRCLWSCLCYLIRICWGNNQHPLRSYEVRHSSQTSEEHFQERHEQFSLEINHTNGGSCERLKERQELPYWGRAWSGFLWDEDCDRLTQTDSVSPSSWRARVSYRETH